MATKIPPYHLTTVLKRDAVSTPPDHGLDTGLGVVTNLRLQMFGAIVVAAFCVSCRGLTGRTHERSPRCDVIASEPARIELRDGRSMSIDATSSAASADRMLFLGTFVHLWPQGATGTTPPVAADSLMGVELDRRGVLRAVPRPESAGRALFPRVVARGQRSFEVVAFSAEDGAELSAEPLDSVSVWYGRYADGRWGRIRRLGAFARVSVQSEFGSQLVVVDGGSAIAFPFSDREPASSGGVVLLRLTPNSTYIDTLRTLTRPSYVSLSADGSASSSLIATMTMSPPERASSGPQQIYMARFDKTWQPAARIAGDAERAAVAPTAFTGRQGVAVTWTSWSAMRPSTSHIEWSKLEPRDVVRRVVVDSGAHAFAPMFLVVAGHPVWIYRRGDSGDSASLAIGNDSVVIHRTSFRVPFENPKAQAVATSATTVRFLTLRRGSSATEPVALSFYTDLELHCTQTR